MTLPDFRIRYPAAKINFTTDVGILNSDIDNYPPPQGQARFDHMRMTLLGLLMQQASFSEPTQRGEGTAWFDLNTLSLKIWHNNGWHLYADVIPLAVDGSGNVITLSDWYATAADAIATLSPEIVFSGQVTANGINSISIPSTLRNGIATDARCFIYHNGLLIDPRAASLIGSPPASILLTGLTFNSGDVFTVSIRRVPVTTFYGPTVNIP